MAVPHMDNAPTHGSRFRIMGNHDDCLVKSVIQFLEHVKDEGRVLGVEVSLLVRQRER
jgi:hypothetical protein